MQLIKLKKLSQKGDTILEVLISVAVLSLILATSFTLANRSTQATRQAAERSEATKVAQSEIEKLKFYLSQPGLADEPNQDQFFCIDSSGPTMVLVNLNGLITNLPAVDIPANYNAIDADCRWGTNDRYAVIIQRSNGANQNTYTAYVRWDSVTGRTVEKISVVHRLHLDLVASVPLGGASSGTIITQLPPSISISATSPRSTGQTSTISWTVTNSVNTCNATGSWSGSKSISGGSEPTGALASGIYTYTLTCDNAFGSASDSATVLVLTPINIFGSSFSSCGPVPGDTYTCSVSGTSVFSCQGYDARYPISPTSGSGYTGLFLDYTDATAPCSPSPTPPAPWTYNIDVYINGTRVVNNYQLSTAGGTTIIPFSSPVSAVTSIRFVWNNNEWVTGPSGPLSYDPDLQINRIGLR